MWIHWTHLVIAIWLIIAPFFLGFEGAGRASSMVSGILVGMLALSALYGKKA